VRPGCIHPKHDIRSWLTNAAVRVCDITLVTAALLPNFFVVVTCSLKYVTLLFHNSRLEINAIHFVKWKKLHNRTRFSFCLIWHWPSSRSVKLRSCQLKCSELKAENDHLAHSIGEYKRVKWGLLFSIHFFYEIPNKSQQDSHPEPKAWFTTATIRCGPFLSHENFICAHNIELAYSPQISLNKNHQWPA